MFVEVSAWIHALCGKVGGSDCCLGDPLSQLQEIVESLQQVKHKGGSRPAIRTLGMGDVAGDCKMFATCNPFPGS